MNCCEPLWQACAGHACKNVGTGSVPGLEDLLGREQNQQNRLGSVTWLFLAGALLPVGHSLV